MADLQFPAKLNSAGQLAQIFLTSKLTALIMVAVLLMALMALFMTPREYNPQITVPAANVVMVKPGASAEEIHNLMVKPLETILHALSGVDNTYGYAANDFGMVTVQFKVGEDQEDSLVKLYNQIAKNMDRMPAGAMEPMVKAINVDDVPIMTLTLASDRYPDHVLREIGLSLNEHLRNVEGVSLTEVVGGAPRAINVWVDPNRVAGLGLSLDQVDQMLRGVNVSLPAGGLVQMNQNHPLRFEGFLYDAKSLADTIIGAPEGRPIFLRDIARVEDGPKELDESSRLAFGPASETPLFYGEAPAVTLVLSKKPGTNAVNVANAVLAKLEHLKRAALPEGVHVVVTRDEGAKANDAVNTLVEHLGIAIGSVVVILILFLGWREAGIVTLTVPLILFVVLSVGLMAGQSINRITLFALILSLGLLVDAAIVVIENIHRHIHHCKNPDNFGRALIFSTNEIGNPTNIATVAVILAFVPMAFVTGMMGPFMRPIPFNVPIAMLASLAIAYMVVPWAAYIFLKKKAVKAANAQLAHGGDKHEPDWLHKSYVIVITPLINSFSLRYLSFLMVIALLIGAMVMPAWQFVRPDGMNTPLSPFGVELKMLPNDDTNTFLVQVDMPAGASLEGTDEVARAVGEMIGRNPYVTDYQTFLGRTAPIDFAALVRGDEMMRGANVAQLRVNLVHKHHRAKASHDIVFDLSQELKTVRAKYPVAKIKLYETPPGPPVRSQILAELYGPDYEKLRAAAGDVRTIFNDVYGIVNVDDSVTDASITYEIKVDRQKALLSGVAPGQVAKLLHDYVEGFSPGDLHVDDALEPINIVVRLPREVRARPDDLLALNIANMQGKQVPLAAFASVSEAATVKPIYDREQYPVVMVGGELLTSSPVYAVLHMNDLLESQPLPSGVTFTTANLGFNEVVPDNVSSYTLLWGGEMRLTLDVFRDLGSAFIVALIFIYLLLVAYYRSFVLPLIVMGAIPLTLVGVFPGHWLTDQAFTATSMIGVIALAGIVVRNSLLLIDFILDYRAQGYSLKEAVIEAGAVRFRPILLTALAIILGSAIMITDPVFGGLAVSLIFGTFASTLLTLIVIPLLYYIWQRGSEKAAA